MSILVIFKIAAIGIITAIVNMLLKQAGKDEIATIVSFVGLAVALVVMIDVVTQMHKTLTDLFGI